MPLPHGLHTHAVILTPCLTSPLSCVPSTSPLTFVLLFLFISPLQAPGPSADGCAPDAYRVGCLPRWTCLVFLQTLATLPPRTPPICFHVTLVLVHGIHRPEPPVPLIEAGQERWMRKQWSRALEEHEFMESARLMNRYQHLCKKNGRKCEWMAVPYRTPSELSENICNAAQRSGASNIVCGSRGLGTLERALLGSTSSSLVHHCPANVSVIKE